MDQDTKNLIERARAAIRRNQELRAKVQELREIGLKIKTPSIKEGAFDNKEIFTDIKS